MVKSEQWLGKRNYSCIKDLNSFKIWSTSTRLVINSPFICLPALTWYILWYLDFKYHIFWSCVCIIVHSFLLIILDTCKNSMSINRFRSGFNQSRYSIFQIAYINLLILSWTSTSLQFPKNLISWWPRIFHKQGNVVFQYLWNSFCFSQRKCSDKDATATDLQGFWDMIYYQVFFICVLVFWISVFVGATLYSSTDWICAYECSRCRPRGIDLHSVFAWKCLRRRRSFLS